MRYTYSCPDCHARLPASLLRRCVTCDRRYCARCARSHFQRFTDHLREMTPAEARRRRADERQLEMWNANMRKRQIDVLDAKAAAAAREASETSEREIGHGNE